MQPIQSYASRVGTTAAVIAVMPDAVWGHFRQLLATPRHDFDVTTVFAANVQ